ncbi:MAG: hypothetical protein D3909_10370, partial [Candidatus Electrothrix sp. ATG1]|nr:hypothetical protein [Candidatus Electrothrix sp. ATG1]
ATDVGGTSEIVSNKTGLLLSEKHDPIELSIFIDKFRESIYYDASIRYQIRSVWKQVFYSKQNYRTFSQYLSSFC